MPDKNLYGHSYDKLEKVKGSSPSPHAKKKGSTYSHDQSLKGANGRRGPNLESLRS